MSKPTGCTAEGHDIGDCHDLDCPEARRGPPTGDCLDARLTIDRCINCGDVFDENAERAARREPHGDWRPCPNPRPGSQEFKDCGVGRHMYQPQVERDADRIMLDGCTWQLDACGGSSERERMSDAVAEAIEQLEAWADWRIAGDDTKPPVALSDLADKALEEEFRRFCSDRIRRRPRRAWDGIPDMAIRYLKAAAILRDGWRPT